MAAIAPAADLPVTIRFRAQVNDEIFACGKHFDGVGVTKSKISGRDFRFYVSSVRLLDAAGKETPISLDQDGKWQLDDLALLDFENGTGGCINGNPDMNGQVTGLVPAGDYQGLRFILGIPFNTNHLDPLSQPSPLNLTAMMWSWNSGHLFARLDFSSAGIPAGTFIHLGSTGCMPDEVENAVPAICSSPNRVEVSFASFDPVRQIVIADLGALLRETDVDVTKNKALQGIKLHGCMSFPETADCEGPFAALGLPGGKHGAREQTFFRVGPDPVAEPRARAAR